MIVENVHLQAGVTTHPSAFPWLSGLSMCISKRITILVISRSLWKYTSIHCSHRLDAHKKDYCEAAQHLGMEHHFGKEFLLEKKQKLILIVDQL